MGKEFRISLLTLGYVGDRLQATSFLHSLPRRNSKGARRLGEFEGCYLSLLLLQVQARRHTCPLRPKSRIGNR